MAVTIHGRTQFAGDAPSANHCDGNSPSPVYTPIDAHALCYGSGVTVARMPPMLLTYFNRTTNTPDYVDFAQVGLEPTHTITQAAFYQLNY